MKKYTSFYGWEEHISIEIKDETTHEYKKAILNTLYASEFWMVQAYIDGNDKDEYRTEKFHYYDNIKDEYVEVLWDEIIDKFYFDGCFILKLKNIEYEDSLYCDEGEFLFNIILRDNVDGSIFESINGLEK